MPSDHDPRDIGKPRMRGWLHTYAFFVAAGLRHRAVLAGRDPPRHRAAGELAIYSLTVCGLFGVSALYHRRVWSPAGYAS